MNAHDNKAVGAGHGLRPPLYVAINEVSGADVENMPSRVMECLAREGYTVTLVPLLKSQSIEKTLTPHIREALNKEGLVVAAGGDGTVRAVAQLCHRYGAPMAVIPLGTFNYVARALGIPLTLEEAAEALLHSTPRRCSAGFVNDVMFLNNASFGLYPALIREREKATAIFGRKRLVGALSALLSVCKRQKIFSILLTENGAKAAQKTTMVFVGNNSHQLSSFSLDASACTKENKLALFILKPVSRLRMMTVLLRAVFHRLHLEPMLTQICATEFEVATQRKQLDVVLDGEIMRCTTPLCFRVEPNALVVMVPPESDA